MSFKGFTSAWYVLPKDTPMKNSVDPMRLKPGALKSRVLHFTSEPQDCTEHIINPFPNDKF